MCSSTDSTDEPVRRRRTRIKKFDAAEEDPLAIGSDIHCCRVRIAICQQALGLA